jgi:hypothetical protein
MTNKLFVLGRFAHDPQSILAAIYRLALVSVELCLNIGIAELSIAPFADGKTRFHKSQFALRHDCSLAHVGGMA